MIVYKPGDALDVCLWKLYYMFTGDIRIMRTIHVLDDAHYFNLPKLTCSVVLMDLMLEHEASIANL